jgi:GMP synthase-like glutamine amidotransferase
MATELARSAAGPQAWRLGRSFCTQFHPEVSESIVRRWVEGGGDVEAQKYGRDPAALVADTRRNVADSRPNAERLVDWFVAEVASS